MRRTFICDTNNKRLLKQKEKMAKKDVVFDKSMTFEIFQSDRNRFW